MKQIDLLLLHPPVVRPSSPPLGLLSLAGYLRRQGLRVEWLDLNAAAFRDLLTSAGLPPPQDRFSKRAVRGLHQALSDLRSPAILRDFPGYKRAVRILGQVLRLRSEGPLHTPSLTLTDYRHPLWSPRRSVDLRAAAAGETVFPLSGVMEGPALEAIGTLRPRWVGLSVNYLSQALPAMALAGRIRSRFPETRIVVGGSLITLWGSRVARIDPSRRFVDQWIQGPGELPLARILGRPHTQGEPRREPPDYSHVDWSLYLSPEPILPLSLSRGCYWGRCRFCMEPLAWASYDGTRLDFLPTAEREAEKRGIPWIHFTDSALSPAALRGLAGWRAGLNWFGFARFERELNDAQLVRDLWASGCRMLQLGLESGSQHLLDRMGKGIRLEDVSQILRILHEEGIGTYVYLMVGHPGEQWDDARRSLEFVERHSPWIDFLSCSITNLPQWAAPPQGVHLVPFRGDGEDLGLYTDFLAGSGLDRRRARWFLDRCIKRNQAVRPLLKRDPPAFTSVHAPLFFRATGSPPPVPS